MLHLNKHKTRRTLGAFLGLALGFTPLASWATISLKPAALVEAPVVKVSDIFEGVEGSTAELDLFRAPAPGKSRILNARQLRSLARYADIEWDSRLAPHQYQVSRASTVITAKQIEEELSFALEQSGAVGPLFINVSRQLRDIHIAPDQSPMIAIENVQYDHRSGKFTAILKAALDSAMPKAWSISGRAHTAMEVPVLSRLVRPGEQITVNDIAWTTLRVDRVPQGTITDVTSMLGMTPRRPIKPGATIMERYLQAPRLVKKGETVTILYTVGALKLATTAIALQHGARNEPIQFRNIKSGRTIDAMMTKPGQATTTQQAMKLAAR